ncbi:MAG: tetratricopeptide repeat protein [Candidatus Competibacteraceae bacterium]|nr:tetratricopeptide repeat protein [Candidatus Competibacteraceae bacterium]
MAAAIHRTSNALGEAEKLCQELLHFSSWLPDPKENALTIQTMVLLGDIYSCMNESKWQQSLEWYQQAVEKAELALGLDNSITLATIDRQVELLRKLGQNDKADNLESRRKDNIQFSRSEDTIETATTFSRIGNALYRKEKYGKAEPMLKRALTLRKYLLGDNNFYTADSSNDLANLYKIQGRYVEAEPLYLDALSIHKEVLGSRDAYVAHCLQSLAGLYRTQGRYAEAESLCLDALSIHKEVLGSQNTHVAHGLHCLAGLCRDQDRYAEAESLYLEALAIYKEVLGNRHPYTGTTTNSLAALYQDQDRLQQHRQSPHRYGVDPVRPRPKVRHRPLHDQADRKTRNLDRGRQSPRKNPKNPLDPLKISKGYNLSQTQDQDDPCHPFCWLPEDRQSPPQAKGPGQSRILQGQGLRQHLHCRCSPGLRNHPRKPVRR